MERRNEKEQREIRKTAKKKAIKKAAIFGLVIFSICLLYLLILSQAAGILQDSSKIIIFIKTLGVMLISILVVTILVGRYLMYTNEIEKEVKKRSVLLVENFLSEYSRTEVIPIKTKIKYCTFLTKELPSKGKFYATLGTNKYVIIEFKFENDTSYLFVESIEKELFTKCYELSIHTEN